MSGARLDESRKQVEALLAKNARLRGMVLRLEEMVAILAGVKVTA